MNLQTSLLFTGKLVFLFSMLVPHAFADSSSNLPPPVKTDRILILSPHPDDETISTAGVLQKALKAGAEVRVVLLTNGENNLSSFMVYDDRFFFGPKRILRMGVMRKQETVNAMKTFGIAEKNVISLGYPDNGMLEIMTKRWGKAKPFSSEFSHAKRVPYSDALSPGAPYLGESVLKDMEQVLLEYRPTRIFVSHPADMNPDHQALYLFMQTALWNLEGKIDPPKIYSYLVHAEKWPSPKGYRPELKMTLPPEISDSRLSNINLDLSPEEISNKYTALQEYPSQIQYASNRLVSFVRENELFSHYPVIKIGQTADSSALTYTKEGENLLIRLKLKRSLNKWLGTSVFLLSYKKNVSFSVMPKIEIVMRMNRFYFKDKQEKVLKKETQCKSNGKELACSIPLSLLGDPDFIMSGSQTKLKDLSMDERAWRVLEFNQVPAKGKDD